jgi:hypothetical protein
VEIGEVEVSLVPLFQDEALEVKVLEDRVGYYTIV